MVAKEPDARFATMDELIVALDHCGTDATDAQREDTLRSKPLQQKTDA
jgi:hypothetical protein